MEQQFLSLFESAKTSADAAVTSSSMIPEVHRCVAALAQLKRFPVISSRVLLLTPVAKQVECLTRHPVKMIKAAASCLLYTWRRKLYARHPSIDGKTRLTKSGGVSRNGTLIVKMRGRILGRVEVGMPIKTVKNEEKKVRSILVESLTRVANETEAGLRRAVSSRDPICVAADVESVMFQKMGAFNGAKTVKYRSVLFNLKDPKNPDLRRKVLLGQIKPEKLVTMTSEEMASNHRQFENAQIRIKSLLKEKKAGQEYKSVDPVES
ncbi:hypothetical protein D5086_012058 [Populus alba]|uniref:Uncharacterized protein n=1 Tax=Populus alba TaxID=43335 RepID=A0ACC4C1S7_POPAL